MHILKIIHGYPPLYNAGSEIYSQSVCNEFSKRHKVSVFTREENLYAKDFTIRKEPRNANLCLYIVNNPQGKDGYRHKQMDEAFGRMIDEIKPDIAYIGHLNHLSTGIIDELYSRHIPIIFMLHDYWLMCPRGQFLTRSIGQENNFMVCEGQEDSKCACTCYSPYFSGDENDNTDANAWTNWVTRRMKVTRSIIDKVNLFIAPAKYLRNRFIKDFGVPKEKIIYMDYGFPLDYLQKVMKHNDPGRPFTFGYIGTHIPAKGVNMLIDAFKRIKVPAELYIFGRDNGQSTAALKKEATFSQNPITFCGEYMNDQLVDKVFRNVDCIVVPSIWAENSPLVIHEAQECGIPVITANYGGMIEYVHHHENGLIFKHRDTNSLYEQMIWAIGHPTEMKKFGERGYLYAYDHHVPNVHEHCKTLIKIFENELQK